MRRQRQAKLQHADDEQINEITVFRSWPCNPVNVRRDRITTFLFKDGDFGSQYSQTSAGFKLESTWRSCRRDLATIG